MTNVGWIGLGAMGAPMATFRRQGRTRGHGLRHRPAEGRGPGRRRRQAAATVADAAADADVLVLMVATAEQAESVLYGDGKAAAALKPGSVVLLMATVGPAAVEDWATRLAVAASRSSTRRCPAVPPGPARVIC